LEELILPPHVTYPFSLDPIIFQQIEALNPWCSFSMFLIGEVEGDVQAVYVTRQRHRRSLHVCVGALRHASSMQSAHYISIRQLDVLIGKTCEKCLQLIRYIIIQEHEEACHGCEKEKETTTFYFHEKKLYSSK
jgi:hypothetical protein